MDVLPQWILRTALSTSDALCANLTAFRPNNNNNKGHHSNNGTANRDCVPSLDLNLYHDTKTEIPCEHHRQTFLYGEEVHLYFRRRSFVEHVEDASNSPPPKKQQQEDGKEEENIIVFHKDKAAEGDDVNTDFLNDNHPLCFEKMWEDLDPSLDANCSMSSDESEDNEDSTTAAPSKPPIPQEIIIDQSSSSVSRLRTPPGRRSRNNKRSSHRKQQLSKMTLLQAPRPLTRTAARKSLDSQQRDGEFMIALNASSSTASTSSSSSSSSGISSLGISSAFQHRRLVKESNKYHQEDDASRDDSLPLEDDSLLEDLDKLLVDHKRHDYHARLAALPQEDSVNQGAPLSQREAAPNSEDEDEELRFVDESLPCTTTSRMISRQTKVALSWIASPPPLMRKKKAPSGEDVTSLWRGVVDDEGNETLLDGEASSILVSDESKLVVYQVGSSPRSTTAIEPNARARTVATSAQTLFRLSSKSATVTKASPTEDATTVDGGRSSCRGSYFQDGSSYSSAFHHDQSRFELSTPTRFQRTAATVRSFPIVETNSIHRSHWFLPSGSGSSSQISRGLSTPSNTTVHSLDDEKSI